MSTEGTSRLHIIVSCASRKGRPPKLSLGTIEKGNVRSRARAWWNLINLTSNNAESSAFVVARELYKGNYWSIVQQLSTEAKLHEFDPQIWVVSAGYGLISALDSLLPYSATFTKGDIDGISAGAKEVDASAQWWNEVSQFNLPDSDNPRSLTELLDTYKQDHFLIVVSTDYLAAIQTDLVNGVNQLGHEAKMILISSKDGVISDELKPYYIATDARLLCDPNCPPKCGQHLLGRNVRGSIGVALARQVLRNIDDWGFSPESVRGKVESALATCPTLFAHNRILVKDITVKEFISTELKLGAAVSPTSLLKKFRESGFACEQKRFKYLFQEVVKKPYED